MEKQVHQYFWLGGKWQDKTTNIYAIKQSKYDNELEPETHPFDQGLKHVITMAYNIFIPILAHGFKQRCLSSLSLSQSKWLVNTCKMHH